MVEQGLLGKKTRRGFYDYSGAEPLPMDVKEVNSEQ
jgi:3-hydroxyacyl-CoA dehydrogenase